MPRKKLIAANLKMYKTPEQTREFFANFLPLVWDHSRDEIVICPPSQTFRPRLRKPKARA